MQAAGHVYGQGLHDCTKRLLPTEGFYFFVRGISNKNYCSCGKNMPQIGKSISCELNRLVASE